ncbi:DUF4118 domain-containing protein [Streptosporangium sp. NPDC006930]|uniref:sensor histidine kinase n=1 Tax=unclassified Streptosporangium TaxID=2632669 RepID=UPI003447CA73
MPERLLSLLLRTKRPPLSLGIICVVLSVAAGVLLSLLLESMAPGISLGGVYLLGILLISLEWGLGLGLVSVVASAAAFDYFNLPPPGTLLLETRWLWAPLPIFIVVALTTSAIAVLARSLGIRAEQRRREADLSTRLAHILLRAENLRAALPPASRLLAETMEAPNAEIRLGEVPADEGGEAIPLTENDVRTGTLLLPARLPEAIRWRLRERMVPSLEALLLAARDRENTGIALAANRDKLRRIAEEQMALRRVATLAAQGISSSELFSAVAFEVGALMEAEHAAITRYDPDHVTVVGSWSRQDCLEKTLPIGSEWPLDEVSLAAIMMKTRRPARRTDYVKGAGAIARWSKAGGIVAGMGAPVIVDGSLWGGLLIFSSTSQTKFEEMEERLLDFAELVGTAIMKAQARADLAASRARIVAASDATRRRIERDLHDGAQQRLVSLGLELRAMESCVPPSMTELRKQISHTVHGLTGVVNDLQELSRGIHPAILSKGGLVPALKTLARRSAVPVDLELDSVPRLPERVEAAVYYTAAEALTNVVKHAHASVVCVTLGMNGSGIRLSVRDNGSGGADYGKGSGLIGLKDRVETLGGKLKVVSKDGEGTALSVTVPVVTVPVVTTPS